MKLARLFLREFDQREQLQRRREENQACIAEITQSFEEFVFLRRMAEYLEFSELTHDPWNGSSRARLLEVVFAY